MYNINSHINVHCFFKKLPGEAGNVPLGDYISNILYDVIVSTKNQNRPQKSKKKKKTSHFFLKMADTNTFLSI